MTDSEEVQTGISSPFDLLRSNITPTAYTSSQILNLISQKESDITRLDVEITRAQAGSDALLKKQRELRGELDAYKAVLAPVRRLPPEILGEIFVIYTEDSNYPRPNASLLKLCQICSLWRNVALGHSVLWKTIKMYLEPQNYAKCLEMMKIWCKRAKSVPLDISLRTKYLELSTMDIMTPLIPSLPTVRFLSLLLAHKTLESVLISDIPSGSMALLEILSIQIYPDFTSHDDDPLVLDAPSIFKDAPRLRSLNIRSSDYNPFEIQNLQVPFSHIVELHLQNISLPDDVAAVLFRQLVNVEHLSLKIQRSRDLDAFPDSLFPIVLPRLRRLGVTTNLPRTLCRIFRMVTLPVLNALYITLDGPFELNFAEFHDLQTRSSFNLIEVSVSFISFMPGGLERLLRANASLTLLDIDHSYCLTPQIMRLLTYSPEDTNPVLPKLEKLVISEYWEMMDDDSLISMLKSR